MYFQMIMAALGGLFIGGGSIYCLQRKYRERELKRIAELAEDILNDRRIEAVASGEETLYAKLEHDLVRVQEMMQGRRDSAEKSRDEIQKLISEIAHQMRTPLTNLETYLGFLKENLAEEAAPNEVTPNEAALEETAPNEAIPEETVPREATQNDVIMRSVNAMENSTETLCFLVENFIKISRLEQHIIQLRKEEPDLLKTLRNALGQIQNQAEEKQLRFEIILPEKMDCMHDSNWLGEAIYNILDNAVKYSEHGGVIEIRLSGNEMFRKLRVRDYGIGIEAGEENRIFQRFYRGTRVTDQKGFGIGLYLAREIVNRHGGFLVVKRMERGIMMEMNLPYGLLEIC